MTGTVQSRQPPTLSESRITPASPSLYSENQEATPCYRLPSSSSSRFCISASCRRSICVSFLSRLTSS